MFMLAGCSWMDTYVGTECGTDLVQTVEQCADRMEPAAKVELINQLAK
jgi:hypothetical protein